MKVGLKKKRRKVKRSTVWPLLIDLLFILKLMNIYDSFNLQIYKLAQFGFCSICTTNLKLFTLQINMNSCRYRLVCNDEAVSTLQSVYLPMFEKLLKCEALMTDENL